MIHHKSIVEYSDDLIERSADDNLLNDDNLIHIDIDINIDIQVKSNPDEEMTGNNLQEKNSEINIEDLFPQFQDQIVCKRRMREVLKQSSKFF